MNLSELQNKQKEFDEKYFAINSPDFEKTRHILLHLMDSVGKLAAYCEAKEHNINNQPSTTHLQEDVIPDFLLHSLQLANIFGVNLETNYFKKLEANAKKMASK
jgi:hypothetical protein